MPASASKRNYVILSVAVASLAASVLGVSGRVSALAQQPPPAAQPDPQVTSAPVAAAAPDPAVELEKKRDQTRSELDALSKTINLSSSKVAELQKSIEDLDKSTSSVRQALID